MINHQVIKDGHLCLILVVEDHNRGLYFLSTLTTLLLNMRIRQNLIMFADHKYHFAG